MGAARATDVDTARELARRLDALLEQEGGPDEA
jgi:hypothetical protein